MEAGVPRFGNAPQICTIYNHYVRKSAIIGYAYATAWKARSAYRYSVESTVYLSPVVAGRGWAPVYTSPSSMTCAAAICIYSWRSGCVSSVEVLR